MYAYYRTERRRTVVHDLRKEFWVQLVNWFPNPIESDPMPTPFKTGSNYSILSQNPFINVQASLWLITGKPWNTQTTYKWSRMGYEWWKRKFGLSECIEHFISCQSWRLHDMLSNCSTINYLYTLNAIFISSVWLGGLV